VNRDTIAERSQVAQEEKERKIKRLQQQLQQDVDRELTFSPRINSNYKFKKTPRDSFLKGIQSALERQQHRLESLRRAREDAQQITFTPQISTYSKSLPRAEPVHERLYRLGQQGQQRSSPDLHTTSHSVSPSRSASFGGDVALDETGQPLFTPRINALPPTVVRDERVEDSLYQDAKNRQLRRQLLMANLRIEEENSRAQRKINEQSKEMVRRREEKELERAFLRATDENVDAILTAETMGRALHFMGYFRDEYARSEAENEVLQHLYHEGMDLRFFQDLMLDPAVAREMRKFSVNRLVYHGQSREDGSNGSEKDMSQQRPQSARTPGSATRHLLLLEQAEVANQRREELRRKADEKVAKECTFQPSTNSSHLEARQVSFKDPGQIMKLTEELRAKHREAQERKEHEDNKKELEECTFKPDIARTASYKQVLVPPAQTSLPKGYQQVVNRMRRAKEERDDKPTAFESSLRTDAASPASPPKPTKPQPFSFELDKRKRTRPLLYMDVNLGPGKTGRIGIHEGDDPAVLAQNFAEAYKLDPVLTGRLEELLETHMMNLIPGYVRQERSVPSYAAQSSQQRHQRSDVPAGTDGHDVLDSDGEEGGSYSAQYASSSPT
jgi:hypothetical protein